MAFLQNEKSRFQAEIEAAGAEITNLTAQLQAQQQAIVAAQARVSGAQAKLTVPAGSDGEIAALALGVTPVVFSHVRDANGTEQRHARAMNTALWGISDSPLMRQLLAVGGPAVRASYVGISSTSSERVGPCRRCGWVVNPMDSYLWLPWIAG